MAIETVMLFGVPLAACLVTGLVAHVPGKARSRTWLGVLAVIWAGFTAAMFFGMGQASGMDGLVYLLALIYLAAPAGIGAGIGGLVGWLRSEKVTYA